MGGLSVSSVDTEVIKSFDVRSVKIGYLGGPVEIVRGSDQVRVIYKQKSPIQVSLDIASETLNLGDMELHGRIPKMGFGTDVKAVAIVEVIKGTIVHLAPGADVVIAPGMLFGGSYRI